jgi:hypothetical protein
VNEQTDENFEEFQPILDAASNYEASKWVLGDAVLEICGPPVKPGINNGSGERIKQAAEFLQDNGIDFNAKYLTEMRDISHLFPVPKRLGAAGISWSVFREFRSCPQSLLGRIRKNPDLVMKVSEAKKIVADIKATREKEAAKIAAETAADPVVEPPVEPIAVEPIMFEPIETDAGDTQFVPDKEPEETTDKQSAKTFAAKIEESDEMFTIAVKLINFVKSAHPDDPDWINEMIDSVEKTQDELKKLKSLLRGLSNKSKPVSNGGDNVVTPFPMAAAPGE